MATVKLFSLNRMAKFDNLASGEPVYFVPGDLVAICETAHYGQINVFLDRGTTLTVCATLEQFEREINRALQATKDDMDAFTQRTADDIKEQIRGIKAEFESKKNEAAFSQNDFYPDLDKDKKGYN